MMLEDIGQYLQEKGIGEIGTDLFIGYFPDTPDDCTVLLESEGKGENRMAGTQTPGLQVVARCKNNYSYASGKLQAMHDVLKQIGFEENSETASGVVINGRQYFHVQPVFSGSKRMDDDENGRIRITKNYDITKEEE